MLVASEGRAGFALPCNFGGRGRGRGRRWWLSISTPPDCLTDCLRRSLLDDIYRLFGMTNLPRGTDVISRAASHHIEQNRTGSAGGRRSGEGKPILAEVVIKQLLKKLGRAERRNGQPTQTLRDRRRTRWSSNTRRWILLQSRLAGCPITPSLPPFPIRPVRPLRPGGS